MIIVTGGAGLIGSDIVRSLGDKGIINTLVVDSLGGGTRSVNLVDLSVVDYMDKEGLLIQIVAGGDSDDIKTAFHEGACSSTTGWGGKYMMNSNYQYSKELLHYCLKRKIPFLYASSAAIYGGRTSDFIESREYRKSSNVYGYSRFLFDGYMCQILPEASSQIVNFRYFNVYGPHRGHKGSMASVALHLNTQLNDGETSELFEGSGNFKRDFVYVGGVVAVDLWFLEDGVLSIFNLGIGRTEFFQAIAGATLAYHKKGSAEYIPFPEKLKGRYQAFIQANLTSLRVAGCDKSFKTVAEGVTERMAWLDRGT